MTATTATRIIRDLARQDIARRDEDPDAGTRAADVEIDGWYQAGGEAGDLDVCRAIDALGRDEAARIYAAEIARDTARTVTARRPDLASGDAIAAVLTADPTLTADEVIAALDEAAEEHAANVAHEAAIN